MLKPIRTVRLKTVGLGIRFARGIMERAASVGSYDLSESELVFAMGAARERDDLMSVLELLDEVLDLIRQGFDRHANALTLRIINNVGIMLSRGGFSREYFNAVGIYNKISAAVYGKTENFNISECRGDIHKQITLLQAEQAKQKSGGDQKDAPRFDGAKSFKLFKTVSERGTLTINTLNSGMLQIMARNPELLKMLKLDKTFMELSLRNIESIRRRTERAMSVQRFFDALTAEQIELLGQFVVNKNLFSELREKSNSDHDLKYLLENSTEKSLSEFFETLKQITKEQSTLSEERSYFASAEKMKEFFVGAQRSEIERLIKELEKDYLHRSEARTLTDALRLYDVETENRRIADEKITELYRIAETALKRKISEESFSEERFISALGTSRELKKFFADYAWENYRSDETVKRYAEYMKNMVSVSEDNLFDSEHTAFRTENRVISEGTSASTDETTKESFADFLINSGELSLKFSESVKNSFLSTSADVAAAFAEYLVNAVREDSSAHYSEQIRLVAEKAENILYYEDSNIEEKSAETFSLICSAWNESASQLSELYASFTQSGSNHEEILKLYSCLPKNSFTAVSEFLEAAAQGDAYFISLSKDFLKQSYSVLNKIGGLFDITEEDTEYTFYDALCDMPENTLRLLLPLAGISGNGVYSDSGTYLNTGDGTRENALAAKSAELSENTVLVGQTSAFAVSAAFAEYLSSTVLSDSSDHYSESTRVLAERVENVLHKKGSDINGEVSDIRGRSAEALALIYNEWNNNSTQLSELYTSFTENHADREEILRLCSRLPQDDIAEISNILNSEFISSETNFFSLNSNSLKQLEKLFEQMNSLADFTSSANFENSANYFNANFNNEYDLSGTTSEVLENAPDLVLSTDTRGERVSSTQTAESSAFTERISDTVIDRLRTEKDLYRLISAEKASELRAIFAVLPSVSSRSERRIYNIAQPESRLVSKSIVTDKAFYNALTAFNGVTAENITDGILLNSFFSENVYPALTTREYFFTWESGSVTLFNRAAANKTHIRTNGFFEKRSDAVLTLSERISEKFSAENQHSDYNTAVELFYTDEYFESSGRASTSVNYVVPAAAVSIDSDDVSEKLGNIRGAIENINTEIAGMKRREEEVSRDFVTKSEQKVFERELKSSIERDIYLAGKRHGIY